MVKFRALMAIIASTSALHVSAQSIRGAEESPDSFVGISETSDDVYETSLASEPIVPNDVRSFDVRGFKLGMSPREIRRVARREGIKAKSLPITSLDWNATVTENANQSLGVRSPIRRTQIWREQSGGDRFGNSIFLKASLRREGGSELTTIDYSFKAEGQTRDEIRSALIKKYGKPCTNTDTSMAWGVCSKEPFDRGVDRNSPFMTMEFNGAFGPQLFLSMGTRHARELRTQFDADVAAKAGATGRTPRF